MTFRFFTTGMALCYLVIMLLSLGAENETCRLVSAFRSSLGQTCHPPILSRQWYSHSDRSSLPTFDAPACRHATSTSLSCGLLEALQNALGGGGATAKKATASHILIQGGGSQARATLLDLKASIGDDPLKFGEAAAQYSDCSSASKGGDLGEFETGSMAKEFDKVVFDPQTPIGVVQGPIQTEFGYHLILVKERSD